MPFVLCKVLFISVGAALALNCVQHSTSISVSAYWNVRKCHMHKGLLQAFLLLHMAKEPYWTGVTWPLTPVLLPIDPALLQCEAWQHTSAVSTATNILAAMEFSFFSPNTPIESNSCETLDLLVHATGSSQPRTISGHLCVHACTTGTEHNPLEFVQQTLVSTRVVSSGFPGFCLQLVSSYREELWQ